MSNVYTYPCDEAVVRSADDIAPCSKAQGRWVLAATILGSSMAFIDGTVVNIALPVMQADLDASLAQLQWFVESYALLLAALLLVGGMLGDRFGRRNIFGLGVVIFAAASLWCGLAPDATQLIIARGVQGAGAALLVPGSLAIISATFSEAQRGRAIGTWSALTALAMAVGPLLGGWLVDEVSWRWIFFINLPPAAVVIWILLRHVRPIAPNADKGGIDALGSILAAAGLGILVFGLIEAGHAGLGDGRALGALALGLIVLGLFVMVELRRRAPMLPLGLFRVRNFAGANAVTFMLYAALGGSLFFLPFNLIQVHGYSATAAGASFLPFIAIMFLLSRWSGGLVDRFGGRLPLTVGPIVAAIGFLLFALPGATGNYWGTFFPAMVVLGLGMAISVAPLTTVVMGAVEEERAGVASGVNNAASRVSALLAIAVMGVIVAAVFEGGLDRELASLDIPSHALQTLEMERAKLAGASVPAGLAADLAAAIEGAINSAFVSGFRVVMLAGAGLALASAATAFLMVQPGKAAVRGA